MSTYDRIHAILVDVLMFEVPAMITPASHIVRDLGAESLNIAEIAVAIENEFGLEVELETIHKAPTVNELVAMVDAALAARA